MHWNGNENLEKEAMKEEQWKKDCTLNSKAAQAYISVGKSSLKQRLPRLD